MKKFTEEAALRTLKAKHDIKISNKTLTVENDVTKRVNDLGNRSWGKIDFLVNYCKYSLIRGSAR